MRSPEFHDSPVFHVRELTVQLKDHVLFRDFDLTIPRRGRIGIIGRSGVGKSTLLRAIASYIWPPRSKWREMTHPQGRCFYAAQRPNLPQEITVKTLMEAFGATRDDCARVFERLCLHHVWAKRIRMLSGGEQQRLALAAAHFVNADIDILDEPVTGLDPDLKLKATKFLSESVSARESALLVVSHDATTLGLLCDQVCACGAHGTPILFQSPYPRSIEAITRGVDRNSFNDLLEWMTRL